MEKNKKDIKKAGMTTTGKGLIVGILVCMVAMLLLFASIEEIVEQNVEKEKMFQAVYVWTPLGAEGAPGVGASGFLEIFFMNTSSLNSTGYGLNNSATHETWSNANMPGTTPNAYANADNFDLEDFQSQQTFIIMVRVRYNKPHAWNGSAFLNTSCDCQITVSCTGWVVGVNIANISGDQYVTRNNTADDYIFINFVWDNGGTGYQIADDAILTVSEIYIEARF